MTRAWMLALGLGLGCGSGEQSERSKAGEPASMSAGPSAGPSAGERERVPNVEAEPSASAPLEAERVPEPKLLEPLGELAPAAALAPSSLPPMPPLTAPAVPDVHAGGAWSIAGLRRDPEPRLAEGDAGVDIEVLAYVQEIYVPPSCSDPAACPPAKQPHLWAADAPGMRGHKRAMLVVNYAFSIPEFDAATWKGAEAVVLEVGKQYRFRGKFRQLSDTGFSDRAGLLDFVAVQVSDPSTGVTRWVTPPGAPWHPISLLRAKE